MVTYSLNYKINGLFYISKYILFLGWFACVSIFSTTIKSLGFFFQNVQLHKLQHCVALQFCSLDLKKGRSKIYVLVNLNYEYENSLRLCKTSDMTDAISSGEVAVVSSQTGMGDGRRCPTNTCMPPPTHTHKLKSLSPRILPAAYQHLFIATNFAFTIKILLLMIVSFGKDLSVFSATFLCLCHKSILLFLYVAKTLQPLLFKHSQNSFICLYAFKIMTSFIPFHTVFRTFIHFYA